MKPIVFQNYEQFLEEVQTANQSENDRIVIDFQSLVDHLEVMEQVLVLQMALAKIHKPCMIYFPYPGSEKMEVSDYDAYVQELGKLKGVCLSQ